VSWHPVAATDDLVARHVYHGLLLAQELAIWRDDDGAVNIWENRCLHRGVRLSIGTNEGRALKCAYHGWRYATQSAACLAIPAHPATTPARAIAARRYPVVERYGLVWSSLASLNALRDLPDYGLARDEAAPLVLRAIAVEASAQASLTYLGTTDVFADLGVTGARPAGAWGVALQGEDERDERAPRTLLLVQPHDSDACTIRGLVFPHPGALVQMDVLRAWDARLCAARARLEAAR
jgi:nitrite reductase/ring-hydroxylating ferredoxin subunit